MNEQTNIMENADSFGVRFRHGVCGLIIDEIMKHHDSKEIVPPRNMGREGHSNVPIGQMYEVKVDPGTAQQVSQGFESLHRAICAKVYLIPPETPYN